MTPHEIHEAITAMGLESLPAAAAAKALNPLTATDIISADVRRYLRESELWFLTGPSSMAGSFQTAIDSGQLPTPLAAALGELYSSVFGGSAETISSRTNPDIAGKFFSGWTALVQIGVATKAQCEGFYQLGGGQPFLEITAEQITKAKSEVEKQLADQLAAEQLRIEFDALWNEHASAAIDNGNRAELANGLRSIANEIEA